jgi:hypothetical protein
LFQVIPLDADVVSPTLAIVGPSDGGYTGGPTTVTVDATDDLLVGYVQVLIDGTPVGGPLTSAPYVATWDAGAVSEGPHVLSAVAFDASGNSANTAITVNVDNIAPSVTLTSPAAGTVYLASTALLSAEAADNDVIMGVQFAVDGVPFGPEFMVEPFAVDWDCTTAADGIHSLSATARDRSGNHSASAVSVVVDHTDPTVGMTSPTHGAILSGTSFTVTASAADALGIASVQFLLDGANLGGPDTQGPFSASWTGATEGAHVLSATARDQSGRFATAAPITVRVDNLAPPAPAAVRDGLSADAQFTNSSNTLSANWDPVTDPGSGVAYYRMAIGSSPGGTQKMAYTNIGNVTTYTKTGLSLSNGTLYYVSIRAVDNSGKVGPVRTSNGIRVDTSAPSVSITAPKNKATVKGTAVQITANASDTYGIARVQFTLDNVNLGPPDTSSPYGMTWNTTTVPNGAHVLKAVAIDMAGNSKTSSEIRVTVNN